jgi:hypothetical protein
MRTQRAQGCPPEHFCLAAEQTMQFLAFLPLVRLPTGCSGGLLLKSGETFSPSLSLMTSSSSSSVKCDSAAGVEGGEALALLIFFSVHRMPIFYRILFSWNVAHWSSEKHNAENGYREKTGHLVIVYPKHHDPR